MKKIISLTTLIIIIAAGAFIAANLVVSSKESNHNLNKEVVTGSAVRNPALVAKMESLYNTNLQRDLTVDDLSGLDGLVNGDEYASGEVKELKWFIENKETLHISHSINSLEVYASTGQQPFCITDAMSHLKVYIKHSEEDLLANNLAELPADLEKWRNDVKEIQSKDATYFKNFEDINKRVSDVLQRIKNGDRSKQISSDLYYIEIYGVC